ncbi:MAG: enoyl-CoA hydratase [Rhodospirillaceae bacterium]|nr:enoyl-CoA hydratase [Rhodospirillaceae bacterium]|tara:strand:- start:19206 stop:19982 length:777 start_codon:yes stop_codon:yes gene_type:complete
MSYETILVETRKNVGLITFNRPEALNALSTTLITELAEALRVMEKTDEIGAIVLTGSEKAFAAGADIKEMQSKSWPDSFVEDFITDGWEQVAACRKPIIAAVSGFALGGGCEIAMMCDFILASETAQFGQPEIKIGVWPGAGGSQRLTRLVGKSKSMEMCLTGRMMDADEAERSGLVSRIIPVADLVEDAVATAQKIASMSRPATMMVKDVVDRAYETTLAEGVRYERRMFQASFGTPDQREGMAAFVEKRKPKFGSD